MITVYHAPRSRSTRVVWLMEELGEDYKIVPVTIPVAPEYLEVSPIGSIPAIDDDGIVLSESIAILQYITGRRLPDAMAFTVSPQEPADYAAHLQFLHYGESSLTAPLSAVFRTRILGGEGQQDSFTVNDQLNSFIKRIPLLDLRMADGRDYVMGDKFTIADISIGHALGMALALKLEDHLSQPVRDYAARLQARPAYQRAVAK